MIEKKNILNVKQAKRKIQSKMNKIQNREKEMKTFLFIEKIGKTENLFLD